MKEVIFISGIDTDAGKTIVTGNLAKKYISQGKKTITVKFAQTGCEGISEDILMHRKIMGCELFEDDKNFTTCHYVFKVPCSPHLAAELENSTIDVRIIENNIEKLKQKYDVVIIEGVGGLCVPITRDLLVLDWLEKQNIPLVLVTTPKLGSINHTIMSLELCKVRNLNLKTLVYNFYSDVLPVIEQDTKEVFKQYLKKNFPSTEFIVQGKYE